MWHELGTGMRRSIERGTLRQGTEVLRRLGHRIDDDRAGRPQGVGRACPDDSDGVALARRVPARTADRVAADQHATWTAGAGWNAGRSPDRSPRSASAAKTLGAVAPSLGRARRTRRPPPPGPWRADRLGLTSADIPGAVPTTFAHGGIAFAPALSTGPRPRPYRYGMQSYTIGQAARLLGVSPDTARRWADAGRVVTHRDEGGRRLIDGRDLAAFSVELAKAGTGEEETSYTSVRNAFPGIVTAIKLGDVAAQVEIQAGPHRLVSLLTREAVEELGLEVGMEATARVKSTNVHIDRV